MFFTAQFRLLSQFQSRSLIIAGYILFVSLSFDNFGFEWNVLSGNEKKTFRLNSMLFNLWQIFIRTFVQTYRQTICSVIMYFVCIFCILSCLPWNNWIGRRRSFFMEVTGWSCSVAIQRVRSGCRACRKCPRWKAYTLKEERYSRVGRERMYKTLHESWMGRLKKEKSDGKVAWIDRWLVIELSAFSSWGRCHETFVTRLVLVESNNWG